MKTLEEIAKEKGKQLLIENIVVPIPKENVIKYDKEFFVEASGKQHSCKGVLKDVPVTRYTENLNGRVYSKQLSQQLVLS